MPKLVDLTGMKFGRLTVVARDLQHVRAHTVWRCVCDCGNEHVTTTTLLRNGHTTSCGCLRREKTSERSLIDLTGMKFGRLTVIECDPVRMHDHVVWHCVCDCGNQRSVFGQLLREGRTISCGCFRREQLIKRNTTHGMSKTRVYGIWKGMKGRCLNPNNSSYDYYGGRGDVPITLCEYYRSFENWYADLCDPPEGLSQNRIDNNRGYEPGNCQWATRVQQNANRRPYKKRNARGANLADIRAYSDALARAAGGAP